MSAFKDHLDDSNLFVSSLLHDMPYVKYAKYFEYKFSFTSKIIGTMKEILRGAMSLGTSVMIPTPLLWARVSTLFNISTGINAAGLSIGCLHLKSLGYWSHSVS